MRNILHAVRQLDFARPRRNMKVKKKVRVKHVQGMRIMEGIIVDDSVPGGPPWYERQRLMLTLRLGDRVVRLPG